MLDISFLNFLMLIWTIFSGVSHKTFLDKKRTYWLSTFLEVCRAITQHSKTKFNKKYFIKN
jgi:hypothetical protein